MTEDEKDRKALATRMREAIIRELIPENDDRAEEDLFGLAPSPTWPQASLCTPTKPLAATSATGA